RLNFMFHAPAMSQRTQVLIGYLINDAERGQHRQQLAPNLLEHPSSGLLRKLLAEQLRFLRLAQSVGKPHRFRDHRKSLGTVEIIVHGVVKELGDALANERLSLGAKASPSSLT